MHTVLSVFSWLLNMILFAIKWVPSTILICQPIIIIQIGDFAALLLHTDSLLIYVLILHELILQRLRAVG